MQSLLLGLLLLSPPAPYEPRLLGPGWVEMFLGQASLADVIVQAPGGLGGGGGGVTLPVTDTTSIVEGSADATKEVRIEADGISTGTVRVWTAPDSNTTIPIFSQIITFAGPTAARTVTLPDAAFTVAGQNFANTFSAAGGQIFSAAYAGFNSGVYIYLGTSATLGRIVGSTQTTPDAGFLAVGSVSNSWVIAELGDTTPSATFDFLNGACLSAACTHPAVIWRSANQQTQEYAQVDYNALYNRQNKTLTESAATSTHRISIAAEEGCGGEYLYTIYATDGSTPQVRQGRVIFSVTNDGGTETCVLGTPEETDNTPTGTLTTTVTCDTTPTNAVDLQQNAVSSLVQTTLRVDGVVIMQGPCLSTPQ